MRRPTRVLVSALAAAAPALGLVTPQVVSAPAAATESTVNSVRLNGYEASLVASINSARRAAGLRALVVTAGTTDVARRWSWKLARAQALSHNPSIVRNLERAGSSAWTMISENVGEAMADNPTALFNAYMASPPHRANILDRRARYLGIGVVERGLLAWNTLDFTNAYSTSYGRTRMPAPGLTMDRQRITSTTDVAALERPDQRFGTSRAGHVTATRVRFTGPSSGNDAGFAYLRRHGSGHAELLMRDALDLSQAHSLRLQLAAHDPTGRRLAVQVVLERAFVGRVRLGTIRVGARRTWYSLPLPAAGRSFRDGLILRVGSRSLSAVGGRAKLAVVDVRAAV